MSLWLPEDEILANNPQVLAESLERYRRVLDGSGYAFWEWGLHDNSYRCGGSFWAKLGYMTVDEAVTCVENVQEYVHPDDFKMVYDVVLSHLRDNTPIDMVYRIKAKDGSYWWTQACASSTRNEEGRVTYLSGVNFDLSHLKDTEKALRLSEARHERILAASNDGIWEWSIDENSQEGRFHTSHSCWKHLDYTEEEVDALPEDERLSIWRSHIHPHDLIKMKDALKRHFVEKEPFDVECRMFGSDGNMFWIRSRGQAIFNGQGQAILMSGINIDISELKQAQERVRKAKDDAEKANNAKSSFLSSMSHELRTPLNAIMGFSQLAMTNKNLDSTQRQNSKQVYNAGEHLLQLINDVLDLSQIESGKVSLSIEPVSPYRLVNECFELVRSSARQRHIRLFCEADGCKNVYVYADAIRLKQCLLNLINNAIKYNATGGEINVSLSKMDEQLLLSVADTGDGIAQDKQDQLFQPFNRLGAENSTVEGTGIGLVITKELIEKMQGTLHYDANVAKGACFKIALPLASVVSLEGSVEVDDQQDQLNVSLSDICESKTIIYIEDNPSNIHLMKSLLKPYQNIHLQCYEDPFIGLYQVRKQKPDLVILDINLPNITGLELASILKQDTTTQHLPCVALSANAMPFDITKGKEAGFDEYLTKPIKLDKLITLFNQLLADRQVA